MKKLIISLVLASVTTIAQAKECTPIVGVTVTGKESIINCINNYNGPTRIYETRKRTRPFGRPYGDYPGYFSRPSRYGGRYGRPYGVHYLRY